MSGDDAELGVMADFPTLHNVCVRCEVSMEIPGCKEYTPYLIGRREGSPCSTCFHKREEHTAAKLRELVEDMSFGVADDEDPSSEEDDEILFRMVDEEMGDGIGFSDMVDSLGSQLDESIREAAEEKEREETEERRTVVQISEQVAVMGIEETQQLSRRSLEPSPRIGIVDQIDWPEDIVLGDNDGRTPPPLPAKRGQKPAEEVGEFAVLSDSHTGQIDDLARMLEDLETKGDQLGDRISTLSERTSSSGPPAQKCQGCGISAPTTLCSHCVVKKKLIRKRRASRVGGVQIIKDVKGFSLETGLLKPKDDGRVRVVETDRYTPFYQHYFLNKPHDIFVGRYGPKEDPLILCVELPGEMPEGVEGEPMEQMLMRALIFSCKPLSKRSEERWLFLPPHLPLMKGLKAEKPELADVKFKRVADTQAFGEGLLKYESQILSNTDRFKFGVLYVKEDQTNDEDAMFSNREGSPEFTEFLEMLADKVTLKGFDKSKYSGGLNRTDDSTGKYAYYTEIKGLQIVFHVNTLLPHIETDKQKLHKKRHIGNDVVMVVFCDSSKVLFDPDEIHSQFNHVFIVVVPLMKGGKRCYRVAVTRKPGVPRVPPDLVHPAIFEKGDIFREFLLTKMINGERKAMYAPQFVRKMYRTRLELMNRLVADVRYDGTNILKSAWSSAKSTAKSSWAKRKVASATPTPETSPAPKEDPTWRKKMHSSLNRMSRVSKDRDPEGTPIKSIKPSKHKRTKSGTPKFVLKKDKISQDKEK